MKFGFVTCVELGLSCIKEIYAIGGELDLLITLEDEIAHNKSGRVFIDDLSKSHSVNLVKCTNINEPRVIQKIKAHNIDWLFIIGWSQIAYEELLNTPRKGVLGIHPTLLPVGRGRAPITWPIIKGHSKTGVTLFKLDAGVDTGPILEQYPLTIAKNETVTSLYERVNEAHKILIRNVWDRLQTNDINLVPQNERNATIWPERKPEDGELFSSMSCEEADRLIRAVTKPYPGAFIKSKGNKYIIWSSSKIVHNTEMDNVIQINNSMLKAQFIDGFIESHDWEIQAS